MSEFQFMRESLSDVKPEKLIQAIHTNSSDHWNDQIGTLQASIYRTKLVQCLLSIAAIGIGGYVWQEQDRVTRISILYPSLILGILSWYWAKSIRERDRQEISLIACSVNFDEHALDVIRWLGEEGRDRLSKYGGIIVSGLYSNPQLLTLILTYITKNLDLVSLENIRKFGPGLKPVLDRTLDASLRDVAQTLAQDLQRRGVNSSEWKSSLAENTL